jgi:CheY-like chemotaxis protein/anti-sigma regulatory factor (Ser/Thr protein kinase)
MGDNSQITNYLLTIEDVSSRKKRIDELDENRERAEFNSYLKSELLTRISHKIRTPLNTIEGFTDFLNDPNLDSEKRRQFTELITQSNSQLLDIVTELVDNDIFEDGLESTHRAGVNLNALLEKIHRHFTSKNQNKEVVLRYKSALSDEDSTILTDEIKVEHVLMNLIENALKFTSKGHVEFGYRVRGNNLEFYVEDTGTGIPDDLREELLRPLYTDGDQDRHTSISGLGLSFARTYVELLGGKFWLDSKPNKGSTFYFSIPYVKDTPAEREEKKSRSVSTSEIKKPATLLIAEDEDLNFKLLLLILSKLGIKTIRAKNGSEAVDLVRSNKDIDLVLMDINMPVMDGYEATRKLKEISPDMPVIAQTAYSSYENQEKAMDCGCSDFISKPFNKEELISKINEQLVSRQ